MNKKDTILIELKNVNAAYNGRLVLENVNFRISDNDFIGIIGPNGGGKTTLVKIMLQLIKPVSGKVIFQTSKEKGNLPIGYLPQINSFDPKFPISVKDVISSGIMSKSWMIKRFNKAERSKTNRIMEEMGISDLRNKAIGELSGGQMQRVFLARAVVSSPRLLILDEPNTFVDNQFEHELYDKLKALNKTMAIVIVSHDVGMISTYIKTIACVNRELHYHASNIISQEQLKEYNCPIQLITHGDIPHTVLEQHKH